MRSKPAPFSFSCGAATRTAFPLRSHRHKLILTAAPQSGQTMIFMIMALLILGVVIIWVFDVHTVLHLKARTQNAGDSAAMAAARWQGVSLNLIGDLNILRALALSSGDTNAADRITDVQARLCFVGPLVGLLASQQAAKNNRTYVNTGFTSNLATHAELVLSYYAGNTNLFPEPYPQAWQEYGLMLSAIAAQGLAAGPDNTWYFTDSTERHWLMSRNFYEAVASSDWCWFYWQPDGLDTLNSYSDYQFWPDLPAAESLVNTANSEILGLALFPFVARLPGGNPTVAYMNEISHERAISPDTISNEVSELAQTWYGYAWTAWSALAPENNFPIRPLTVKPEYDYSGADAVMRVEAAADPRMPAAFPGMQTFLTSFSPSAARLTQAVTVARSVTWTAAAKPFGYLLADGSAVRPDTYTIVLPAFRNVRLIPVDAATAANAGAYDLVWRRHIQEHLGAYLLGGPAALDPDCWYCQQLQTWDDPDFRQEGIDWLNNTNNSCEHYGPGSGPGGGTRRGH